MSLRPMELAVQVFVAVAAAVWAAVFAATMPGSSTGLGISVIALLAAIAGGLVIPVRWLLLTIGAFALGVAVGAAITGLWLLAAPVAVIGIIAVGAWLVRLVPILRLHRTGFRTAGLVVESDGQRAESGETTHSTVKFRVEFTDADGGPRSVVMTDTFAVDVRPKVGDVVTVYADPANPERATAVFDART
ncbi:DUF3592 domain-containing protein [Gordonia sp. MP11Mi]|uniref:DUF3592 domain-containing protein n=1 Tax=Gordonia sp. MP11Mi TaxID=3022769 RepID=A0AA97GVX5_9ACTN